MGLAAAKNKRKLGTDPNNTKWSRNETTFGQKILRAQGWQPGEFLGAKDAAHAVHHTEASSSHIKVTLKDDNLGLGAKRNNGDECTGLFDFQHLLGRLNGKSEDVLEAEKQKRENHIRNHYLEQKIGTIRFVRGGWLVGDVVKEKVTEEDGAPQSDSVDQQAETTPSEDTNSAEPTDRKSKKRKAEADSNEEDEKVEKKDKKSKKRKTDTEAETDSESSRLKKKDKKDKKEKKDKKDKKEKKEKKDKKKSEESSSDDVESSATETKKSKKDKKKEKKEKKDKKKDKKEKKRKEKESSDSATESEDSKSKDKKRRKDGAETEASTPGGSGTSTPTVTSSTRFLARQRFIAQKKMAFTDSAALNQIFMIKS